MITSMVVNHPKKLGCCQLSSFGNLLDKLANMQESWVLLATKYIQETQLLPSFTVGMSFHHRKMFQYKCQGLAKGNEDWKNISRFYWKKDGIIDSNNIGIALWATEHPCCHCQFADYRSKTTSAIPITAKEMSKMVAVGTLPVLRCA